MPRLSAEDAAMAELVAKRTRQEQLRQYLDTQVAVRKAAAEARKSDTLAYAQAQQASLEAWQAQEEARKAEEAERKAAYRRELDRQAVGDHSRREQERTFRQMGLPTTSTMRSGMGADLPYALVDTAVMGTLGVTVRQVVVSKDGGPLPTRRKKRSEHFIE